MENVSTIRFPACDTGKNLGLSSRIVVWLIGSPWFTWLQCHDFASAVAVSEMADFQLKGCVFCELREVCG